MINSAMTYRDAGAKVATARIQKDEARASFHRSWFSKAKALESQEDRIVAQAEFDQGYASAQPARHGLG